MKYRIIFTTVIALSLYSFTANAGTVNGLTSYASDTILNASDLNNDNTQIKSAVDGNASDISTNSINIGSNTADIGTNITNISTNTADIANISAAAGVAGIAYVSEGTCCTDISTWTIGQSLQQLILLAPSNGYAIVSFTGVCMINHQINSGFSKILYAISQIDGQTSASRGTIQVASASPTGNRVFSCGTQQVYPVTQGSNSFYLNVYSDVAGGTSANMGWINMSAVFVPILYQ